MSKTAKLMIEIPDSESDSNNGGQVTQEVQPRQSNMDSNISGSTAGNDTSKPKPYSRKKPAKSHQNQRMYKMTPNPKNPKQADRNGRKANPKTLTSMNRMRMANHLGSPKHREQVNMFRSNPAESGGAKGGNNNVEFGAGRSETRYKEQSGYHKSEKKKKLKGKIHDAGEKNQKRRKRRKLHHPASTRNLKSKHQKMGLFGGANKTKFQAELGMNNLKKSSALGLLRSNTDFRNYGKSKAGKLTFGSEVRKRGDQYKITDFRSPKAKRMHRLDPTKRKPNTTKHLNYSQGSPFFKSQKKGPKQNSLMSKFLTNPTPSTKTPGPLMDNRAYLRNKQAFIKKNRAHKTDSLRNQIIRYEVGRGSHKRTDLTFNDQKKASRKKKSSPPKWANAEYGHEMFRKKDKRGEPEGGKLKNFQDNTTVKRANSQGSKVLDQGFRKRKQGLLRENHRSRKNTHQNQNIHNTKQEPQRPVFQKKNRSSKPKLIPGSKIKKSLFIQTSFEGGKTEEQSDPDPTQAEIRQNPNISFADSSRANKLESSNVHSRNKHDSHARDKRKSKKHRQKNLNKPIPSQGHHGKTAQANSPDPPARNFNIASSQISSQSHEQKARIAENRNVIGQIRRNKKPNLQISTGLEGSQISLNNRESNKTSGVMTNNVKSPKNKVIGKNLRVEVKEINYPEHIHMKEQMHPKVKKKDLVYLKETNLHPSTAPNKTGKHRSLFKGKKAQEAVLNLHPVKEDFEGGRHKRASQNVFAEEFSGLNSNNKQIYQQSEKAQNRQKRKTQNRKRSKQSGSNNQRMKSSTSKIKNRNLMIETDLQDVEARHINTTKHGSRSGLDPLNQPLGLNVYKSKAVREEFKEREVSASGISLRNAPESKKNRKTNPNRPQRSIASPGARSSSEEPSIFDLKRPIKEIKVIFEKLQWLCKYVSQFSELVERGEDPYDIVRKYVDFIQDRKFNDLVLFVKNERYRKVFNKALLLERWVIFSTFYIFLDRRMTDKHKLIQKFAACVFQNNLLCILLLKLEIKAFARNELKYLFVQVVESQVKRNKRWLSQKLDRKNVLFSIGKNCTLIEALLEEVGKNTSLKIRNGISGLKQMKSMYLDESLEFLLDTFCDYFLNKGIVSVEYTDSVRANEPAPPFLKEPIRKREYTLVVDLDETLVHYQPDGGKVLIRPHTPRFLEECAKYYEIVIFTAAQQEYADWILDRLDTKKCISHRLYRQHTDLRKGTNIKDLSKIGRPLHRTIIVDNIAENFQMQTDNGIFIKSWYDDKNDTALIELFPLLKEIVVKSFPDVRKALKIMREQMQSNIRKGRQPHSNIGLG